MRLFFRLAGFLLFLTIFGCATTEKTKYEHVVEPADVEDVSPEALYERTAALFSRPENLGLDFYSPGYYQSALDALEDAETALGGVHQTTISPTRALIAARKLLEKAQANREKVDRNLKSLVQHRNLLIEIDAPKWQASDWKDVSEEIRELMVLIEEDAIKEAINKEPSVRKDMYALEIDTLLASTLDDARTARRKAEKADAENFSPMLFNSATILIDDTEIYIRSNFRDRKGIKQQANAARLEAERAYKTAIDAKHVLALNEEETERYLIDMKTKINKIVLLSQEDSLPPSTIDEALDQLYSQVEQKQQGEPTNEQPVVEEQVFDPELEESPEIEVLQVLDSLHMESSSLELETDQMVQEEQTFDDIEIIK